MEKGQDEFLAEKSRRDRKSSSVCGQVFQGVDVGVGRGLYSL